MPRRSRGEGALLYKVMELSTVDEQSLERGINTWVRQGWRFDGMQFAMRESSRRPAMAFLLFTREGEAGAAEEAPRRASKASATAPRSIDSARQRLRELAGEGEP